MHWSIICVVQQQNWSAIISSTNLRDAIFAQTKIIWYNMFRGKLSDKWLHRWYESTKLQSSTAGTRQCKPFVWGAKIIKAFIWFHIKVWEQRNKDVHGDDKNNNIGPTKDNSKQQKLQYEIRKLQHQLKRKARPEDEFLFPHINI